MQVPPKIDPSVIPAFAPAGRPSTLPDAAGLVVGEEPGVDVDDGRVKDSVGLVVNCEPEPVAQLGASEAKLSGLGVVEIVELVKEEIAVESSANVVAAAARYEVIFDTCTIHPQTSFLSVHEFQPTMLGLYPISVDILVLRRRPAHGAAWVCFFHEPCLDSKKTCPNY
jgi:hypothetical protein